MSEIYGLIFCIILGTLGHFLYNITNQNKLIGLLFSQNESTWEHLKLGITPITLWTLINFIFTLNWNIFINMSIKIIGFSIVLIIFYYSYKHIIKRNILVLDISIFYLSLSISHLISAKMINLNYTIFMNILSILFFIGLIITYNYLSKNIPNNFLFKH